MIFASRSARRVSKRCPTSSSPRSVCVCMCVCVCVCPRRGRERSWVGVGDGREVSFQGFGGGVSRWYQEQHAKQSATSTHTLHEHDAT